MNRIITLTLILAIFQLMNVGQTPIANGKNKFLGSIYASGQLEGFASYFNQVTPENSGKWGSLETSDGTYNFTNVDVAREFAKTNNFPFRFHVLVWGNQQPTWLKAYTDPQKVVKIKAWFQAVANHYDGSTDARAKLEYIEVVNEALNDPPNNLGANATDAGSGDYVNALKSLNTELNTTPGNYDWVVNAFKLARKYFACDTKLVINEYGVENDATKMSDYITIINLLKANNLVDVVGIQCHAFSTKIYGGNDNTTLLTENLNNLAGTGLPIMVTEMEIDGNVGADQTEKDANQKTEYQRVFPIYWNHKSVIGITFWGFRNGMWRSSTEAYLIDVVTNNPRPALGTYLNTTIRNATPPALNNFITVNCVTSVPKLYKDSEIGFKLYPNPSVNGKITIEFDECICNSKTKLVITDIVGREFVNMQASDNVIEINQKLAPGLYFVKVMSDKEISSKSFVVQK